MAKLRGAKKAAFLRRMARGRAKARRSASSISYKHRRGIVRMPIRRNPLQALIANPSWVPTLYGGDMAKKRRRRKAKGIIPMAKRRRKRRARRASTTQRAYKRKPARRLRRLLTTGRRARVRRGTRVIYINPRRRRKSRRIRRHRNPGFSGVLRAAFVPYAAGVVTSAISAMMDTGLAKWPMVRQLSKVGGVLAIAALWGSRYPQASAAAIGAIGASQGYPLVTKLAGGIVARNPAEVVKGVADMTSTYPEMGALLQGGLGALLNGVTDVPEVTLDYETALQNMSDGDED